MIFNNCCQIAKYFSITDRPEKLFDKNSTAEAKMY